ncbi:hypothetical protein [Deferribacter desulfuricans]|uniref:hypothetical protein n=1 Tax=Deferribacter desulfuricans TaxID=197162 RepID=UPI00129A1F86|nr:hypothetical protein [Deferribacter desulfuricans]
MIDSRFILYINTINKDYKQTTNLTLYIDSVDELISQIKDFKSHAYYMAVIQNKNEMIIEIEEGKLIFPNNQELANALDLHLSYQVTQQTSQSPGSTDSNNESSSSGSKS